MSASRRREWNRVAAEGTILRVRRGGRGSAVHPIRRLHDREYRRGDDDEPEDAVEEQAIVQRHRARRPGLRERRVRRRRLRPVLQQHVQVGEVDLPHREPDGWHDHVVDEAFHHAAERGADDYGDGEIQDVAPEDERSEFPEHGVSWWRFGSSRSNGAARTYVASATASERRNGVSAPSIPAAR